MKARDNFNEDDSSTNSDGELDLNGNGIFDSSIDGLDKNHRPIIGQFIRCAERHDDMTIKETIYPPQNIVSDPWERQWDGKIFNPGKWQQDKGVTDIILETINEYPMVRISTSSTIVFNYNKTVGGYSQYWNGGPSAGAFWDVGIRVLGVAIAAYDRDGTRIGTYPEVPDLLKPSKGFTIIDGYPILIYRYRIGEYKCNWIWDGAIAYVPSSLSKNSKFAPINGIVQKDGDPINIYKFLTGKIGVKLEDVSTVKIHFLGLDSGTSWNAGGNGTGTGEPGGSGLKMVVKPVYLKYNIISQNLDLSPPKSRTQKIKIKKKSTKKALELASRAPALDESVTTNDSSPDINTEDDNDLGTYNKGDTIEVEGDVTSDSEGGNIKGVWCMCDAVAVDTAAAVPTWQTVPAEDGSYNSAAESFKYQCKLPDNIEAGTYSIDLKSLNDLGEDDAGYETLTFVVADDVNEKSEYVAQATSSTVSIIPASGEIKLDIPANTFSDNVTLTISTITPASANASTVIVSSIGFEITNNLGLQPQKEIAVTVKYRDSDVTNLNLDEQKLMLGWYDEAHNRWVALSSQVDTVNNTITSAIKHLSKFGLIQMASAADLKDVIIYPNPYKPGKHPQGLIIDNLTATAEIKIYSITGELIKNVAYTTQNGRAVWDGTNEYGKATASGVYVALIKSDAGTKKIKFALQR